MASIAVGAPLKERLAAYLQQAGCQVKDYGTAPGGTTPTSPPRSPR